MEQYELIWRDALPKIEESISTINYTNFITKLKAIDLVGSKLVLMSQNETQCNMIKTKTLSYIKEAVCSLDYGVTDVELFVGTSKKEYLSKREEETMAPIECAPINPQYTFDNFVVGNSNRYLYAAAKAVAEEPGSLYNPLFVYGASGLGKTHILHAIVNQLRITKPSLNILYSPSEKFLNEYISSIFLTKSAVESNSVFRNRYRNADVLIIDDIQNLSKKQGMQETFFNIFNELYGDNKQIVLSADVDVSEIEFLSDRLRTRFESGLKVQVTPPDLETKIAILQKKAAQKKYILKMDVAEYIASNSGDNVRSLEGLLNKVIFASKLNESPITRELAEEVIETTTTQVEQKEPLNANTIIDAICKYYKVSEEDLKSKKRNKEISEPRHICAYLMVEMLSIPLETIGQSINRDHSTIIHSRNKISETIKINNKISTEVNDIKNLILGK